MSSFLVDKADLEGSGTGDSCSESEYPVVLLGSELDDDADSDRTRLGGGGGESLANKSSKSVLVVEGVQWLAEVLFVGARYRGESQVREPSLCGEKPRDAEHGDGSGLSNGMNSGVELASPAEARASRLGEGEGDGIDFGTADADAVAWLIR